MSATINHFPDLLPAFQENKDRLRDHAWLTEFLRPHCRIRMMGWRGSWLRIIQFPDEFASWLILLAENSVQSYLEIGTSSGGSFMTTDAYLRAAVPGFERSVGYDHATKLRDWKPYRSAAKTIEFRCESSKHIRLGGEYFDAAFIDATHLERWVLRDFKKVRDHCGIVGFHDIVLQGRATVWPAWRKIKPQGIEHWEFINKTVPPECRCGIGAIRLR